MATKLKRPVIRETTVVVQGRPLIVTVEGKVMRFRQKGYRASYTIPIETVFYMAVRGTT